MSGQTWLKMFPGVLPPMDLKQNFIFCFLISYICFECSGWALFILIIGTLNKISPSEVIILQLLPPGGRLSCVCKELVRGEGHHHRGVQHSRCWVAWAQGMTVHSGSV